MTKHHGETDDDRAAGLAAMLDRTVGEPLTVANEFTEVTVHRVDTRNGSRLLITSPRTGQWISLDALEVEALTWQNTRTLEAMVGNINAPLLDGEDPRL
jgi:hypothetical protein